MDAEMMRIYIECREPELYHYFEPEPGVFIAESPNVIARALQAGYEPLSVVVDESLKENKAQTEDVLSQLQETVPVYMADAEMKTRIQGFSMTRGMLASFRRKTMPSLEEICRGKRRVMVLENVMNPTNVGAIFRCAAALGMEALILTKGCADPLYRRAARVSMGTVFQIPWTVMPSMQVDTEAFHVLGFQTAAMALAEDTISISDPSLKAEERLAVLMGTESGGLQETTVQEADYRVKIPMEAGVDSLNVAAAAAIACWELHF